MKKIIMGLCLLLVASLTHAQGLDGLVVEKYYVSNAADSAASNGNLPVGSVTYRFYVDMSSGYKLLDVFGNANHSVTFTTTTGFYNDNVNGATTPDAYDTTKLKHNALMLDSWVSFGRAGKTDIGVLKSEDNGATDYASRNINSILHNNDGFAGIPLTTQDGLLDGSTPATSLLGITTELDPLGDGSVGGNSVVVSGGAWFALGGVSGPTPTNKVLIAQITTDGTLHYELNIILGDSIGGSVTYVNQNVQAGENLFAALQGTLVPDIHPTVSITSPLNNATFIAGSVIADSAVAADADGSVASVQFFVDNVSIGFGTLGGGKYSTNWTSTLGTHVLTAVAVDNVGGQTTSAPVTINIVPAHQPYGVVGSSNNCEAGTFCLPIAAQDSVKNIRGYDLVLHYDASKVIPTGAITVSSDLVTPSYVDYLATVDAAHSQVLISLYFNASAPANSNFHGIGNVFCAEFSKTANFATLDSASFSVDSIQESYIVGVVNRAVNTGLYKTHRDSSFTGSLRFWADNSPLQYDPAHSSQYLITNIYGTDGNCLNASLPVQPDFSGNFVYNVGNGADINIKRDIAGTTDVQSVINGFDAFLTRKVLANDPSFVPTIFQAIAMDVNEDGHISAGDLSQINARAVLLVLEFEQAWNYDNAGNRINPLDPNFNSADWSFVDATRLNTNPAYSRSTSYPGDDGVGFSKARVPVLRPTCIALPATSQFSCTFANSETYNGILLGDVNGNYATVGSNGTLRQSSSNEVVFDLSNAVVNGGYVDVPVSVVATDAINALDFSLQFNMAKLTFVSVNDDVNYLQDLANFNSSDNTLRYTSNSLQNYETGKTLLTVRFAVNGNTIDATDLTSIQGYLNGNLVPAIVNTLPTGLNDLTAANFVSIYPNPANGVLNVSASEKATVQLFDMNGRQVIDPINVNANEKQQINTFTLAAGVYTMKVSNDRFVSVKQVVINK